MKKRILALLLLFLMIISFVIPLASKTNKNDDSEIQQKPDDVTICKNQH